MMGKMKVVRRKEISSVQHPMTMHGTRMKTNRAQQMEHKKMIKGM